MRIRVPLRLAAVSAVVSTSLAAQAFEFRELAAAAGAPLGYAIALPKDFAPEQWRPLVVVMADGARDRVAAERGMRLWGAGLAANGFVVVVPAAAGREADLPALLTHLRQTYRIEQGGMHLAGAEAEGVVSAWKLAVAAPHEFQTVTVWPPALPDDPAPLARLRGRRVQLLTEVGPDRRTAPERVLEALRQRGLEARAVGVAAEIDAEQLAHFFARLHGLRAATGPAADVAQALDDFHDAAAKGDEDRYFALLPDDAVFLGTDATERWTGAEFRKFALPYFERGPAWTYVPFARHVTMAPGGELAWFHEALDNEAYGECRGTGVLQRRDGKWVLRQYDLTIPVPNDLSRGVVARIRAFAEGKAPAVTTVVIVRHAEKGEGDDPDLTDAGKARAERLRRALAALPVQAVFTSEFRRTQATMAPLCAEKKVTAKVMPAAEVRGLVAAIRKQHLGQTVVIAGHSNTVPPILKALGVVEPVTVADDEFDRLFVVTLGPDGSRLLELRYGDG